MEKLRASAAGGFGPSRGDRRTRPPAPGLRNSGTGALWSVGRYGYSWASSVTTGTSAHFLSFNNGGVYPSGYDNRAYGLQLRCLQE